MAVIPYGVDLCSVTVDTSTLPQISTAYGTTIEFIFDSSYDLVNEGLYAIVVQTTGVNPVHAHEWGQHTSNNYAGGTRCYSFDNGDTWTSYPTRDNWFQTKASGIVKDVNDDDVSSVITIPFATQDIDLAAETFTASSSYTITSVVLKLWRQVAYTSGTVTVSIKNAKALPTKANTPAPGNAAANVTLDQATLGWVDGGGADTFNVYYGTESGSLSLVSSAQVGASFTVTGITNGSPYAYLSTRYWRIDSTNDAGTTTGDEWSFTTIRFDAPGVTYFYPTTGQYYRLLIQSDGTYGDPPGVGVENTDYVFLAAGYEANFIKTTRKLVSVANSKIWFEDV
jgi:hypothetical protein